MTINFSVLSKIRVTLIVYSQGYHPLYGWNSVIVVER